MPIISECSRHLEHEPAVGKEASTAAGPIRVHLHSFGKAAERTQGPFQDGGVADRIGLDIWTSYRQMHGHAAADPPALVHLIARSSPFSGTELLQGAVPLSAPGLQLRPY